MALTGSDVRYARGTIDDGTIAIDWFPRAHPALPPAVARGRAPDVLACGYCHLPTGAGRPENAMLAGLPAAYQRAQIAAMRAGLRRSVAAPGWLPIELMLTVAHRVDPRAVAAATAYFASLPVVTHVRVVERATIPRMRELAFVDQPDPRGGTEALGGRIVEVPDDPTAFDRRDPRTTYTAYVPPGALALGARLARGDAEHPACASCHGADMRGAVGPPIAGRSPTGLVRQLAAFRAGLRRLPQDAVMTAELRGRNDTDLIALAAYVANAR